MGNQQFPRTALYPFEIPFLVNLKRIRETRGQPLKKEINDLNFTQKLAGREENGAAAADRV